MIEASPSRCKPEPWTAEQAARAMGVVDEADVAALGVEGAAVGESGDVRAVGREEPKARRMRWVAGGAAIAVVAAAAWWSGAGNRDSREIPVHAGADDALIAGERTPNSGTGDFNSSNGSSHMKIQTTAAAALLGAAAGATALSMSANAAPPGYVAVADSQAQFSGVQGQGGWWYLFDRGEGTALLPIPYFTPYNATPDNGAYAWCPEPVAGFGGSFCMIHRTWSHTNQAYGCDTPQAGLQRPTRRWMASRSTPIIAEIRAILGGPNTSALRVDILADSQVVQSWTTNYGSVPTINATIELASVQQLDFRLDPIDGCAADGCGELMIQIYAPDCNGDSVADYLQLEAGTLPDYNGNNIPDCCEQGVKCTVGNYPVQWRVEDGGNGHWYVRMLDASSWSSSREKCAQVGGHLATITSATENDFIHGVVGANQAWIGGTQTPGSCEPGCGWYWITGEPWTYSNWSPGEPNNDLGQDFLNLYASGAWDDFYDPRPFQYVCEWSTDCNNDSIVDYGQILNGTLADTNTNGIPDICEARLIIRVPADQPTIQAAIDAAPLNTQCIIAVSAGTYAGPIDFKGKSIIVRGAGASQTIISGSGGSSLSVVRFTGGEPAFAALENVSIRGGVTGSPFPGSPQFQVGGGLFAYNSAASVRDCVFENNTAAFGGGAYVWNCTGSIQRCAFRNNSAGADGAGIQLYRGSPTVVDTIVENNTANSRGGGLHIVDGTPNLVRTIVRNNISSNNVGGVSWVPAGNAAAFLSIDGCNVTGNTAAVVQGGIGILEDGATTKVSLHGTTVCENLPRPNVAGRFIDLGGNVVCDCAGDLNLDGVVNGADLGLMLSGWGPCGSSCLYDLNVDGVVNGADLGLLLAAWGTCGS
jgi:hypothetical protein